jgi:hypothetical protein
MLNNMYMKYLSTILLLAFFITCSSFISCGKKDTNTAGDKKDETTKPTDQSTGLTKKDNPTDVNKNPNELGISEGLPKDYPSDIPQPKNAKNMGFLTTSEGTVVTFESDEKPKDILTAFTTEIEKNGYKKDEGGEALMSDDGGLALWKKDTKECSVMLAWDKEKKKSSIVVTYK